MTFFLGVDTGGTYTDAVILEDEKKVIASAKALTSRQDLAIGISEAVRNVLNKSSIKPKDISLVSLSTTLATNALVEDQGGSVALIFVGFRDSDLTKHKIHDALKGDPVLQTKGGHNHAGEETCQLNIEEIKKWILKLDGVSAFAVASQFATRNAAHEVKIIELIKGLTDKPITASHQLSSKLNGPRRALTAVLNARLIGIIDQLISRCEITLSRMSINAPLMVVRGDGALISSSEAREKPIETILSGPAASIVGAKWMTDLTLGFVSDIGGTTTDVALLKDGRPALDPAGARVGNFRTMVEAVAVRTTGLGGDSQVHFVSEGLKGGLHLGPKRLVPISLLAHQEPHIHDILDEQLRTSAPGEYDGKFVRLISNPVEHSLTSRDMKVLSRIERNSKPLKSVIQTRIEIKSLERLVSRGIVQVSGVTPSDASHVLKNMTTWDGEAAEKAITLLGRRRKGSGDLLTETAEDLSRMIIAQLHRQTALFLLESAFHEEDKFNQPAEELANNILMFEGLTGYKNIVKIDTALNLPVVALGASSGSYYPAIGDLLKCDMILPKHSDVANAIGAVVGRITMRVQGSITSPSEGQFRVHFPNGPKDFLNEEKALTSLENFLLDKAINKARGSGAEDIVTRVFRDIKKAKAEARHMFVEAILTVEASGRPRISEKI